METAVKFRSARRRCSAVCASLAALALIVVGVTVGAPGASAATIAGAIKNVTVTPTDPTLTSLMKTDLSWCIPDGSHTGDTFSLTLPDQLTSFPPGFPLLAPDGSVVATAVVVNHVATFTLSNYVTTHQNVCGDAFFTSRLDANKIGPGDSTTLTYTSGGDSWKTPITVQSTTGIDRTRAQKNGKFTRDDQGHDNQTDAILWRLETPAGTFDSATVSDTIASDMSIDCASVVYQIGDPTGPNNALSNIHPYTGSTSTACTATSLTATIGAVALGKVVRVSFLATILDQSSTQANTFTNSQTTTTTVAGKHHTTGAVAHLTQATGGGSGSGTVPTPKVTITKFSTVDGPVKGAFDTAPGKSVAVGTPIPITMTITNPGTESLTHVTVSDVTSSGPALTGLSCDFTALGGPATGTTWVGPFKAGTSFDCTGTVPALSVGVQETDVAAVTGTGAISGTGVTDHNAFNAHTPAPSPAIGIVKKDVKGNDANTLATAVLLPTGGTGLVYTVTNIGTEPLTTVTVSDDLITGGTVTGLTCTFPDATTGTTWSGTFAVGASFTCTAQLSGIAAGTDHEDIGKVTAVGVVSHKPVSATNAYFAQRVAQSFLGEHQSKPPTTTTSQTLPFTGTPTQALVLAGAGMLIAGGLLLAFSRRRRSDSLA